MIEGVVSMRVEQIGLVTLYLGDCREIAPTLPRPAAVISDPPYGMAWDTDTTRFSGGAQAAKRGKEWGGRDQRPVTGGGADRG
jgi:DNA modification methylase